MIKNKKGSLQSAIYIASVLIFFGIVVLFGFKISDEFNTHVQNDALTAVFPDDAKEAGNTLTSVFPNLIDRIFMFFFIGLCIASIILATLVRIHPVFIPLYLIALVIIIFLSGMLSNIYQEMAANTNLVAQSEQMVFMSYILGKLPLFIGIIGFIIMAVMYKIWRNSEE